MLLTSAQIISFVLYLALFIYVWHCLTQNKTVDKRLMLPYLVAVISHGLLSYWQIDGGGAQNLGLFNIFAMTTWLAMCLVGWNLYRHKAYSLLLIALPIAAISIAEAALFQSPVETSLAGKPINLIHILSGIAAMSILLLAALQSMLVLYLDRGLKQHPAKIHSWLGSLEGMERYLVQLLTTGFALMSISLLFVLMLPEEIKTTQAIHKVTLTVASWGVLAFLMFGRYIRGWRGVFAAKWSLVGVFLLLLGYFGSKLAIEFIFN